MARWLYLGVRGNWHMKTVQGESSGRPSSEGPKVASPHIEIFAQKNGHIAVVDNSISFNLTDKSNRRKNRAGTPTGSNSSSSCPLTELTLSGSFLCVFEKLKLFSKLKVFS